MKLIIPRWLYEKMVQELGQEAADLKMRQFDAVAVSDWSEVDSPETGTAEPVQ